MTVDGLKATLRRVPVWAWWGLAIVGFVLLVPMLTFFLREGSLWGRDFGAEAPPSQPVRASAATYVVEDVFTLPSAGPTSDVPLNTTPDSVPMLEVVAPGSDGSVWIVDHPAGERIGARVRRFDAAGTLATEFDTPIGSTLFTPAPDGGIVVDISASETGTERVIRYDSLGKKLGEFPLPEGLLARSLTFDPDGGIWAQAEEWATDVDASEISLESALVPVAIGQPLAVPADPRSLALAGGFFGMDGLLYRTSAQGPMRSDDPWPPYTVVSVQESGSTVATYTVPAGYRPYAADGFGRVYAERPEVGTPVSVGRSTLGDAAGDAVETIVIAADGTTVKLDVPWPRYFSTWSPAVWPRVDGVLVATEPRGERLAVVHLRPGKPRDPARAGDPFSPTLTLIEPYEPVSGDPYVATDDSQRDLLRLVYSPLVSRDASLNPVPELATEIPTKENGGVSPDGLTVRFEIRDGVEWHDGEPVTARDVVATWQYLRRGSLAPAGRPFAGYEFIDDVTAQDNVVTVLLSEPYGPGPESFFPFVLPAHVLPSEREANPAFADAPVGSGPYRIERWEDGSGWYLRAHDGAPLGRPPVDKVLVRFAWGEEALEAYRAPLSPVVWDWVDESSLGELRASSAEVTEYLSGRWWATLFGGQGSLTSDPVIREAYALSYPKEYIFSEVYTSAETAEVPDGYVPGSPAHDPRRAMPSTDDTAAAIALLERAGWTRDKQGLFATGGRTPIFQNTSAHRDWTEAEVPPEAFDAVTASLRSAGIDARHNPAVLRQYESWRRMGGLSFKRFDAVMGLFPGYLDPGWGGLFDPADRPSVSNPYGAAVADFDDDELAKLYSEARAEYDPQERARIGREIAKRALDDLRIALPERHEVRRVTVSGPVSGFAPPALPAGMSATVYDWRIGEGVL